MSRRVPDRIRSAQKDYELDRIESRAEQLSAIAHQYLPTADTELIEVEADAADEFIRRQLREGTVRRIRRSGDRVEFGRPAATAAMFRKIAAAIDARSSWRIGRALAELPAFEVRALKYSIALRWHYVGGGPEPQQLAATFPFLLGADIFTEAEPDYWESAREVVSYYADLASNRRRPTHSARDRIARKLAGLWSVLADRPLTIPHSLDGSSELTGPMIEFVRAAREIYPEVDIPLFSTSSWARILA